MIRKLFSPKEGEGNDDSEKSSQKSDKESDDTEEEESEDSEANGREKSKGKEEEDEEFDDLVNQYKRDPASLPKEQRAIVKKLMGSYTRGMQRAAATREKADMLDRLVVDPEFLEWAEQRQRGIKKPKTRRNSGDGDSEEDEEDEAPVTRKSLRSEIHSAMKSLKDQDDIAEKAEKFKKDNPDWKEWYSDMNALSKHHPTLSYQELYEWVKREAGEDDNEDREERRKESLEIKKRGNISKPNRITGSEAETKERLTLTQALEKAKKSLGWKS